MYTFWGEGGHEKEYSLYSCENVENVEPPLTLLEQIAHFLSGHVAILQTVGKCTLRVHQTTAVAQFVNPGFIRRCAMCEALISGGATGDKKIVRKSVTVL